MYEYASEGWLTRDGCEARERRGEERERRPSLETRDETSGTSRERERRATRRESLRRERRERERERERSESARECEWLVRVLI